MAAASLVISLRLSAADEAKPAARASNAPSLYEVSAENGQVAYVQASADGRVCIFRDPTGNRLNVENDGTYFPGFTITFSQPGSRSSVRVFGSLIFHEQKQPMPMIYDIAGKYVAGIGDGAELEKDMVKRMRSQYNKLPDRFKETMLSFYLFGDKGPDEFGPSSAAVEEMVNQGPGVIKSYEVRTRKIDDPQEASRIQALLNGK